MLRIRERVVCTYHERRAVIERLTANEGEPHRMTINTWKVDFGGFFPTDDP